MLLKDYQSLQTNCTNAASDTDCQAKSSAGLCNSVLADGNTIAYYCKKSCGLCSGSISTQLNCNNLYRNCANGAVCSPATFFSISTITCTCPNNYAGAYCTRSMVIFIFIAMF